MVQRSKDPLNEELAAVLSMPEKRALSDDVASRLRAAILSGAFAPGERLREEALARALGVSRGPVREALAELERQGLVVLNRNRGAVVAQKPRDALEELYTLRLAIEDLAIRRAAEASDPAAIAQMLAVIEAMQTAIDRGITEQEAAEFDLGFHDLIYEAAHHRRLNDMWANMRPQIHVLLLNRNVADVDFREMLVSGHQELLDCIIRADGDCAAVALRDHLGVSYGRVSRSLERQLEQQAANADPEKKENVARGR
ncbi:MAG: GntR family transcriptional regulator [Thermomicrobiales bacterium]|nr:GntR family transcriptional regulator [Thermomicrobiales bacterium]